jgi:hypothetical protein
MRTYALFILAGMTLGCTGCTTVALEQYTLRQIQSSVDYRYQAALNCLAAVADNPNSLPSLCIQSAGATRLTDMESATATTTWSRMVGSFAMQTLGVTLSRSPQEGWTLVPVADYSQMEALRCACLWMLRGPDAPRTSYDGILDSPVTNHSPGPHFGVANRLAKIPTSWLYCGRLKDVPKRTAYSAHCGQTWVWVMPEGMEALSEFTLVLLDIATLDVSNGVTQSPVLVSVFTTMPWKGTTVTFHEDRVILPDYLNRLQCEINGPKPLSLSYCELVNAGNTIPYHGLRTNVKPGPAGQVPAQSLPTRSLLTITEISRGTQQPIPPNGANRSPE